MKQLITETPHNLVWQEVEIPALEHETDVLVQIKAAGICGSDVHIYHGTSPVATYPRVMGHEIVGIVTQTGSACSLISVGDHVIVDQVVACGSCYACSCGRPNVCNRLQVRGVHIDGGYREYMAVPETDLHIIPKQLAWSDAVMIEPMSIAFQAKSRAQVTADDIVFVYGAGALGKSMIKALRMEGARIIAGDISAQRLAEAKELGVQDVVNTGDADWMEQVRQISGGFGPTVSIDCAGIAPSLGYLTEITCNAGRVITMAFLQQPSEVAQLNITAKELDIRGSRLQNRKFKDVIKAYEDGKLSFDGMVSHCIPFADAKDAFALVDSNDPAVKKVALVF